MKKLFILLLLLTTLSNSYCQEITYQKSLDDALTLAVKKNKPVFVMLTVPPGPLPAHANFTSGIDSKEVIEFYNKNFVSYRGSVTDSAATKIRNRFHITVYPAYIFLDTKGQIVYKGSGNASAADKYLDMANQALNRIASGKTISYYEAFEKQGELTADQLKEYITLKEELGLFDNAELIEKYIGFLTVKSFDDYDNVLFVLKAGPLAYGKAFNLSYTNRKIIDSIYKREPLANRIAMNNNITTNTLNEAIKNKDSRMAQNAANFSAGTYGKNYREASRISALDMIYYYRAIKDTGSYFRQASFVYDSYYLNISADSAKKLQQKQLDDLHAATKAKFIEAIDASHTPNNGQSTSLNSITVTSSASDIASALNNVAYEFYTMGTHNTNYLVKALVWCRRAIELKPVAGYYDTMAHLMYRLNFYDEAILNQKKAVEMAGEQSQPATEIAHLKSELNKMVARQL